MSSNRVAKQVRKYVEGNVEEEGKKYDSLFYRGVNRISLLA